MLRRLQSTSVNPAHAAKISVFANGLTVASRPSTGHFCSLGVYVHTGSAFESVGTRGAAYMIDKTAFNSTKNYPATQLVARLEEMGGNVHVQSQREHIAYSAAVFHHHAPEMLQLLGEMACKAVDEKAEFEASKQTVRFEIAQNAWRYDVILPEDLHAVAFQQPPGKQMLRDFVPFDSVGLGNPLVATSDSLARVTPDSVRKFRATFFTPNRMVVAGVGIDHDKLCELAAKHFDLPVPSPGTLEAQADADRDLATSRYTGGVRVVDTTHQPPSPNPDDLKLSHVHIAWEAMPVNDPDIYALATLASLLGGGGSFSAGGPGKGMNSRLYSQVLNRCGWIENINTIHHTYASSSLFGVSAAIPRDERTHQHIVGVIAEQLAGVCEGRKMGREEVGRAKKASKGGMLYGLESQLVQLEDLGRQVLSTGRCIDAVTACARIDAVTASALARTARRVLQGSDEAGSAAYEGMRHTHAKGCGAPSVVVHASLAVGDPLLRVQEQLRLCLLR